MYLTVDQVPWNIIIPAENLDVNGLLLQRAIVIRLLDEWATKRATKDLGYFVALTTLDSIGEGKVRERTGDVLFPVTFSCITFKLFRGEIFEGTVNRIMKHGVLLKCGPIDNIYLSNQKMGDYKYILGENPVFMSDTLPKIEKDTVLRLIVLGTKWLEATREIQVLASLDGNLLGPL